MKTMLTALWFGGAVLAIAAAVAQAADANVPPAKPVEELGPPRGLAFKADLDGTQQRYMLRLPKGLDPCRPHDVLIGLHGATFDRRQYATAERGECKGARDAASLHGMIFVSPDYRGPTSWMGPAAEADMVQLIAILRREYKVRRVFLTGGSMGGAGVLTFAIRHPDLIAGVSCQNGVADLLNLHTSYTPAYEGMKDSFGGRKDETPEQFKQRDPNAYRDRSAAFHADKLTMPLAVTTGGRDTSCPPGPLLELAEKVKKHNADVLVIHRPQTGHETNYADTLAAIQFVIRAADARAAKARE